ncbi:glycosyltransferase family 1 protein [Pterulicium gracile]|uniref:UDP-N-acetylglucosamine transferase subunit ALG13 n=1 Tax=Pterulicium gracile TaxID=1884261 RepID=A0A5C3R1Q4_9AGAR|nr:glycosyltransferase family 1 protein [Pterula gracilis]
MRRVFVTVGSTQFDALVQAVLSPDVLHALSSKGFTRLVLQSGNSASMNSEQLALLEASYSNLAIDVWKFKASLEEEVKEADLVVSHAGSGTILEVLRMGKLLIVVPNPTLLDNHQQELADALVERGHLRAASVQSLASVIAGMDASSIVPFPEVNSSRFRGLIDERLGFTA